MSHPSQFIEREEVPLLEKYDGKFLEILLHKLVSCELEQNDLQSVQARMELEELYADTLRARNLDSWIPEHLKTIRESRKVRC